jgi:hypothetical protein
MYVLGLTSHWCEDSFDTRLPLIPPSARARSSEIA